MTEINLETKVVIKNLCSWDLYFPRIESSGDVKVPQRGVQRLTRGEIQSQVFAGNAMFTGVDGNGNHPKIYIEDKATRVLVGFESEDEKEKQEVLDAEEIKRILALKTLSSFKKNIEEKVVLHSEKALFVEEAKKQKLNDYEKVKFIEEYTGFKFENKKQK